MSILNVAKDKATALEDLNMRWETLIGRIEENKEAISLPDFEAYGWDRLEEFLRRLEDAVNIPLLERARGILAQAKIEITQQILDKLKSGLSVRRNGLIEILNAMATELKEISIEKVLHKCREDLTRYLEESRWDDLVSRAREWKSLGKNLEPLFKEMDDGTHLYNALFERALAEGPWTELVKKLADIENRAFQIGGQTLKEHLRFEEIENPMNPLGKADSDLTTVAKKKEDIRQLLGEEVQVEELIEEHMPLQALSDKLEAKYNEVRRIFGTEQERAELLIRKYNDLANLSGEPARVFPEGLNLKQLHQFIAQQKADIESLENELTKSFSSDARVFIESLSEGRLPENWRSKRVVKVLQELLDKKLSFEVKWRK